MKRSHKCMTSAEVARRILDSSSSDESDVNDSSNFDIDSDVDAPLLNDLEADGEEEIVEDRFDVAKNSSNDKGSNEKGSSSSKKRKEVKLKYSILPSCKCKKKCIEKVPEDQRKIIFDRYWESESTDERRLWLHGRINCKEKKVCRTPSMTAVNKNRQVSREYTFDVEGVAKTVCKIFFLNTLGYRNDKVLTRMYESMTPSKMRPGKDLRGKRTPKHALTEEEKNSIDEHIRSFKPSVSHYRRAHAPLRLYLSPELTGREMYNYYKESQGSCRISYNTYMKRINKMNISFVKLGEEECEVCTAIELHECAQNKEECTKTERMEAIQEGVCEQCDSWKLHIKRDKEARTQYQNDRDTFPEKDHFFLSADMQKVIMLPRLPGQKIAVFTRRIVMFHETFAPLVPDEKIRKEWANEKKKFTKIKPHGMIWHEGIMGRNDEDVCSTAVKLLTQTPYREGKVVNVWWDNCAGQGKNWTLYSQMVYQVNNHPSIEEIIFKYLEKGHTL